MKDDKSIHLMKRRSVSLKTKLTILIIIVSVYPMVLMGIIAAYNYNNILKENFVQDSINNMASISASLNRDIDDMENSIRYTLQNPNFYELVRRQPYAEPNSLDMYELRTDIRYFFSSIIFTEQNYDVGGAYFFNNDQNIFYPQEKGLIFDEDIPYREMWEELGDYRGTQVFVTYLDGHINYYMMQVVIDTETFEPMCMIYYRIDPDYLENIFDDVYHNTGETLFLYRKDGSLIARAGGQNRQAIVEPNEYYLKEPDVYIHKKDGEDYYVITEDIEALGLTVITSISTGVLTEDSRKVMDLIIILYIINIPIIFGISYFLYRNINHPVSTLITTMNQFEGGNFDARISHKRRDEFGILNEAFNDMASNINSLINDVYIKELARKDAEISALQEQINPHFLYNTLESINWRAQLAGENDIASMIQALSKLMDGSINRNNENFITMDKEAEYVKQYMFLVSMRYPDMLKYEEIISDEVKECFVPKLIIQPLLENAVKHGIEPVGEGTITLEAYKEGNFIVIKVSDDGSGMGEYGLIQIRKSIAQEIKEINRQSGKRISIGFRNVTRRIELIYNGQATIEVESKLKVGTSIILKMPFGTELDKDKNLILEGAEDGQI